MSKNAGRQEGEQPSAYTEVATTAGNLVIVLDDVRKAVLFAMENGAPHLGKEILDCVDAVHSGLRKKDRLALAPKCFALREDLGRTIKPFFAGEHTYDWALVSWQDYAEGVRNCMLAEAREAYEREHPGKRYHGDNYPERGER